MITLKFPKIGRKKPTPSSVITDGTISIDAQIYRDTYSAEQLILDEANRILRQPLDYDKEKHDRLKKLSDLGFANAEEVKMVMDNENMRQEKQKLKDKIVYYQRTYPLHKFITHESVKTICDKYGLLLTEPRDYIAEIPDENQKEIVNFKVKESDTRYPDEILDGWMNTRLLMRSMNWQPHHARRVTVEKRQQPGMSSGIYYVDEVCTPKDTMVGPCNLLIVAPEVKLNTKGKKKVGHVLKIDDPIILQPVEMGYIIVTSWGLEASDELVMNPISN